MNPSKELFLKAWERSVEFTRANKVGIFLFWLILVLSDGLNYFFQRGLSAAQAEEGRKIEIIFQLFLLVFTAIFIHFVGNRYRQRDLSIPVLIGESLLLCPGYLLQTILFCLSVVVGLALVVLPGLYVVVTFFFAPVISILFPGYNGKVFMLSHEIFKGQKLSSFFIILITAVVPFIPDGVVLLLTGEIKSMWSLWLSPFDSILFILSEVLVVFYVLNALEERFPQEFQSSTPSISS